MNNVMMTDLGLVSDSIFSSTEIHYPSTTIDVTDRGNGVRRTDASQLDDEPKENAAVKRDARIHHITNIDSFSCLCFLVLRRFDAR